MSVIIIVILVFVIPFVILYIVKALRVINEYERAVVFRFGKFIGVRGPGLIFILPGLESAVIVDLRLQVIEIPRQDVMTADNVAVFTNAICYYRVIDPEKAIIEVENYQEAVFQLAQATTRTAIGETPLDDVLGNREELNERIKTVVAELVHRWGIDVEAVEIKDVELPDKMKRAIARQAEAERLRRGRIIQAEGEEITSKILSEAADIIGSHPEGLHLRTLQTLVEIGAEAETHTVILLPVDVLRTFSGKHVKNSTISISMQENSD